MISNYTNSTETSNYEPPGVPQYIFLSIMILVTFYLTFLYIKSKAFHTYSCYNIIIMSIVIFLATILNMFVRSDVGSEGAQFICGFLKDFFNKIILTILTMQVVILYIGIMKTEVYYSKEKIIFLVGIFSCAGISILIGILFNSLKMHEGKYYEYLDNFTEIKNKNVGLSEEMERRWESIISIEMIFCGIIFVINVFCLAVVLSFISKKNKDAKAGLIEDLGYCKQLLKFVFMFILNIIAIVVSSIFLTFDVFDPKLNQTIYLGACLVIDLCYSINKTVYVETLKIFCKGKAEQVEQGAFELKKKSTFDLEDNADDDEDD